MNGATWAVLASFLCVDCVLVNLTDPTSPGRSVRQDRCLNRGSKSNLSVVCFLTRWTAYPGPLSKFARGSIVNLRVKIWDESTRLTANHLRGMERLRRLSVIGTCHDSGIRLRAGYCDDSRGLEGIESSAFIHTPRLQSLSLVTHPLTHLQHFTGLSQLRRLNLMWLKRLQYVRRSALDPIRATLEDLLVIDNEVSVLEAWMFANMSRLKTVRWFAPFSDVQSHTFSRLPRLQSIALNVRSTILMVSTAFDMKPSALEHLPSLRQLDLRNIKQNVGGLKFQPFCNLTNSNVQTVRANSVHLNALRLCRGLFNCPACGADPVGRPQQILLKRVYFSEESRTLATVLPQGNFPLNISELEVVGSSVNAIDDELARMPLLRRLIIHKDDTYHLQNFPNFIDNIERLTRNPLKFHPFPARLTEVRLLLNRCDCVVLDMIRWFTENTAPGARLLVGCENLKCNACGIKMYRYLEPWQDLHVLTTILNTVCAANSFRNSTLSKDEMCAVKCTEVKKQRTTTAPVGFAWTMEARGWMVGVGVGTALTLSRLFSV